jgi:hypothetical protein
MARANIPRPRGGESRHGSNRRTALVSTRIPWDLLARLQARAARLGIERSEAIRRACADWVASAPEITPLRENFDLVGAVMTVEKCSRAQARVMIRLGQVTVNGRVEKRYALPPGQPGMVYAITRTPNSRG